MSVCVGKSFFLFFLCGSREWADGHQCVGFNPTNKHFFFGFPKEQQHCASIVQKKMLIRVRSNVGVWRVDGLDESSARVDDVMRGIAKTRPMVEYEKPLCFDPACTDRVDVAQPLSRQGLRHGSMIHTRVDPKTCAETGDSATTNVRRVVGQDGNIQIVQANPNENKGFRQGMMPLRDMKMQWTLNDFIALDSQFEFKIQRQKEAVCNGASLDTPSVGDFQTYLRRFGFSRHRVGFLYGKFTEDNKVQVEAVYEPLQETDKTLGFNILDDPMEEKVEQLAQLLGLRRVGWIVGHPPREEGFVLSAAEVIIAAELQLEAADGVEETPFCTVTVSQSDNGTVSVEAYQVSQQCMKMVAEQALDVGEDPHFCVVNDTFTAIQEGKPSKTVENNFFLTVVPIVQHTSELFVSQFPKANRDLDDRTPSNDELKRQLSKSGSAGWTFIDLLADFNLLIFLCNVLDMATDIPKICESIVNRDVPLDDGYKLIIASMAGLDGSY